jgi:hypothetical protein
MTSRAPVPEAGPPTERNGREEYLWQMLEALWPPPARITQLGHLAGRGNGGTEFLVCPTTSRAAFLVPRRPRQVTAAALRRYKTSADMLDRMRWRMTALAAATGLAEILPDRIRIETVATGPGADIARYLSRVLGKELFISIHVGPPRANRKPVLQALSRRGEVLGYAKIGINTLTRNLVKTEAETLAFLAAVPLTRLQPPRLLHYGQWRGHEVLVQEALQPSRPPRGLTELSGAMTELSGMRGISYSYAARSPYWRRLLLGLQALGANGRARSLIEALKYMEPNAADMRLAFGSWHGDWAPWNLAMSKGRVLVWDWERFETGVPVGYDAVHYWMQSALVQREVARSKVAETAIYSAGAVLAPLGIDPDTAKLVTMLYLVEIGLRYLHDRQAEAGASLGRIETWLLPALMRHTQPVRPSVTS